MKRTRWDVLVLFGVSLVVRLAIAALISRPGYMDPSYYAAGAVNLAEGGGLDEPFIWNYLDDPTDVTHAGFLYWMPLPALLAAPFASLFPDSFFALQLPFALLSAFLPPLAYVVAREAGEGRRSARLAGGLVLFSGFFFPYWTLPETFAPFALFGSLALWLAGRRRARWASLLSGLFVGLAHLTRADGVLLLPVVVLAPVLWMLAGTDRPRRVSRRALCVIIGRWALIAVGYLLVMGPWFVRNLLLVGRALSPGGTKTLWLADYDSLYCYGCDLSPAAYLARGWAFVLRSKLLALGVNAQRFLAENCMVFLLPLVAVGFYRRRHRLSSLLPLVYLLAAYLLHSLAFTFPGMRGGFFHASACMWPHLSVVAVVGLGEAVRWVGPRRRWNVRQAQRVFAVAALVAAVGLSAYVARIKLRSWCGVDRAYERVGRWMAERVPDEGVVMVNNPPAFWYYTRRRAVVVPTGDVETLLAVADRYGVTHVLLDKNRPGDLWDVSHPRLWPVLPWDGGTDVALYEVQR